MSDDEFEGLDTGQALDTEGENAGFDGLSQATAAELAAQELEDQEGRAESQEDEELDLDQPYFAYTDKEGKEMELTGQQILDLIEKGRETPPEKPAEEKPTAAEKPAEAKAEEIPGVEPVHWDKVGENFGTLLEENPAEIGPALKDLNIRMILTDPHIQGAIRHVLREELTQEKAVESTYSKLTEDLGTDVHQFIKSGEYESFRKENPIYREATPTEALALSVIARLKAENAELKSGTKKEIETAKKEAGKETIRQLKARGTLRPLRGASRNTGAPKKTTLDPSDPDQRTQGMVETVLRMRQGGGG